jgi:hypothetical protein
VALARLAASQHGVVSHAQLDRLGIRCSGIERHRLHRGVFAVGLPIPRETAAFWRPSWRAGPVQQSATSMPLQRGRS